MKRNEKPNYKQSTPKNNTEEQLAKRKAAKGTQHKARNTSKDVTKVDKRLNSDSSSGESDVPLATLMKRKGVSTGGRQNIRESQTDESQIESVASTSKSQTKPKPPLTKASKRASLTAKTRNEEEETPVKTTKGKRKRDSTSDKSPTNRNKTIKQTGVLTETSSSPLTQLTKTYERIESRQRIDDRPCPYPDWLTSERLKQGKKDLEKALNLYPKYRQLYEVFGSRWELFMQPRFGIIPGGPKHAKIPSIDEFYGEGGEAHEYTCDDLQIFAYFNWKYMGDSLDISTHKDQRIMSHWNLRQYFIYFRVEKFEISPKRTEEINQTFKTSLTLVKSWFIEAMSGNTTEKYGKKASTDTVIPDSVKRRINCKFCEKPPFPYPVSCEKHAEAGRKAVHMHCVREQILMLEMRELFEIEDLPCARHCTSRIPLRLPGDQCRPSTLLYKDVYQNTRECSKCKNWFYIDELKHTCPGKRANPTCMGMPASFGTFVRFPELTEEWKPIDLTTETPKVRDTENDSTVDELVIDETSQSEDEIETDSTPDEFDDMVNYTSRKKGNKFIERSKWEEKKVLLDYSDKRIKSLQKRRKFWKRKASKLVRKYQMAKTTIRRLRKLESAIKQGEDWDEAVRRNDILNWTIQNTRVAQDSQLKILKESMKGIQEVGLSIAKAQSLILTGFKMTLETPTFPQLESPAEPNKAWEDDGEIELQNEENPTVDLTDSDDSEDDNEKFKKSRRSRRNSSEGSPDEPNISGNTKDQPLQKSTTSALPTPDKTKPSGNSNRENERQMNENNELTLDTCEVQIDPSTGMDSQIESQEKDNESSIGDNDNPQ